ncbi:MAG TPA: pilus assembly protein N-terminal domain-containing protein [Rhodocyclaceae bacterium]|nr:pilus assembly protein N-terminal domain-containing protein [Rhodocyclaceae bacterium]HMV54558.1 pilus assembly protein N-terminal domain-containing protein [Rhodocyclaceae bacterium]HMZ83851.1 pilus assembly protein N-terminal domain-containing protein [Rhodocyclaceae bacterium]HNB78662.1 pilus assembly protein N-terminal domain-containing protein [Rhodocyclaceae bacterium]HNH14140.1 pilus assembly protein N-terminal domain-containing protein [Rhodocyclaceae bacterium]
MPQPFTRHTALLSALVLGLALSTGASAETANIEILRSHSRVVEAPFEVATIAMGNSDIVRGTAVTPRRILINGGRIGATSMMLFGKKPEDFLEYRVHVIHDLRVLRKQLEGLDTRIRVETDTNRDAIVLTGVVRSEQVRTRAVDAALSYVGEIERKSMDVPVIVNNTGEVIGTPESMNVSAQQTSRTVSLPGNGQPSIEATTSGGLASAPAAAPAQAIRRDGSASVTNYREIPVDARSTISSTRTTGDGAPRIIDLLTTEEQLAAPASRLEELLASVDSSLRVKMVNSVFHVTGTVGDPAKLTRALTLIDSFVSVNGKGTGDFRVVADRGGVLLRSTENANDTRGTRRTSIQDSSGMVIPIGIEDLSSTLEPSPPKGNITQNLARADAISIAGGKALSMIKVRDMPRVEVQLRIVAVDRNATDQLGINWRLDGPKITIGSLTGEIVPELPTIGSGRSLGEGSTSSTGNSSGNSGTSKIDVGVANLVGLFTPGKYSIAAFLQAIEGKGAASALSEPLLTAVSGESVSFLVGGELPIPGTTTSIGTNSAVGGSTTTTQTIIVFRQFGIQLLLRPTVLENGRISIVLDQFITQPDYGRAITLGGNAVPAFSKRAVRTVTESEDGEIWAVAGLLTEEESKQMQDVPYISKVPILGNLFKKTDDRKIRSELIITVNARRVPDSGPLPPALAGAKPAPERAAEAPQ